MNMIAGTGDVCVVSVIEDGVVKDSFVFIASNTLNGIGATTIGEKQGSNLEL